MVFEKINQYRLSLHLSKLEWSGEIYLSAEHHTKYMVKNDIVTHDEIGNTPKLRDRLTKYGGVSNYVSEICLGRLVHDDNDIETLSNGIVKQWRDSPPHNKLMTNPKITHMGSSTQGHGKIEPWDEIFSTVVFIVK